MKIIILITIGDEFMTKQELNSLSIENIKLILVDQQNLYTPEEISQLQERLQYLINRQDKTEQQPKTKPKQFNCPKCGAPNKSVNTICPYCGYKFKDSDYYNIDNREDQVEDIQPKQESSNAILYVISLLLPIVGIILGIVYIGKDKEHLGRSLILFSIVVSIIYGAIWFNIIK
jgi:predicted nucleic acid-binding Zn ribbon protein